MSFKGKVWSILVSFSKAGSESEAELGHVGRQDRTYSEVTIHCQRPRWQPFLEEKEHLEDTGHTYPEEKVLFKPVF